VPYYMTVNVQYESLPKKTYYRKQSSDHVSHDESGAFSADAKMNYVTFNHLTPNQAANVSVTGYKSGQGIPTSPGAYEL
jgi:hypothetical protein